MNYIVLGCVLSLLTAQMVKFAIDFLVTHKPHVKMLYSNGAMPSSHSSILATLIILVGLDQGFGSAVFAVTLVFSLLIIGDAMGVRSQTGKQSIILNHLMEKNIIEREKVNNIHLRELLGHKPTEVLAGFILGIMFGLMYGYWLLPLLLR